MLNTNLPGSEFDLLHGFQMLSQSNSNYSYFEFCDFLELSFTAFAGLAVILPSFCLLAPIWMRQLAKQFVNKNSSSMADHGVRANED